MSLEDHWYIAVESKELRGKPLAVTIHGEALVLFRDTAGEPRALRDRCAHRNMALSAGKVRDGCVECPYHGWRYGDDGRCVAIPALGDGAAIPASAKVRSLPAIERDGFVWVFTGAGEPVGEPFRFPHIGEPGWTTFVMKTRFDGDVETCLENFLDCPHTVFVHKGWFRNDEPRPLRAKVRRHDTGVDVEFHDEVVSGSVAFRLISGVGKTVRHTDRFIMPNISRVDYDFGPDRAYVITSQCTPVGPAATEVYTAITYRFGRWNPLLKVAFAPLCRKIIAQDVDIVRAHAAQREKFGGEDYVHVSTDLLGLHIRSLRLKRDRGEPPAPPSEKEIVIRF